MKTSLVVAVVIGAFLIGTGVAVYFRVNEHVATQVLTPTASDADGDGVTNEFDYCPHDPTC